MEKQEIEYKGFKAVIWYEVGNRYNLTKWYISYNINDYYDERYYFYTNKYQQKEITSGEILDKIKNEFITNVDKFYTDMESVNKDTLLELIEKYALISVGSYDEHYDYIEKMIFNPILEKYNQNILKVN